MATSPRGQRRRYETDLTDGQWGVGRAAAATGEQGRAEAEAPAAADRERDLVRGADRVCVAAPAHGLPAVGHGVLVVPAVEPRGSGDPSPRSAAGCGARRR